METSPLRTAVLNAWNVAGVAMVVTVAVVSQSWWILAAGGAIEAAWIGFSAQSPRLRRALRAQAEPHHRDHVLKSAQHELGLLPAAERAAVQRVATAAAEIRDECRRNPGLGGDLLMPDLERLEETMADYVHLAVLAHRCDIYLARAKADEIVHDRDEWRRRSVIDADDVERSLAHENVIILEKRIALTTDIRKFSARARAQLALVQNTVALVRDEVLTLSTPRAVTRELDNLVTSLEAIREATREVENTIVLPLPDHTTLTD